MPLHGTLTFCKFTIPISKLVITMRLAHLQFSRAFTTLKVGPFISNSRRHSFRAPRFLRRAQTYRDYESSSSFRFFHLFLASLPTSLFYLYDELLPRDFRLLFAAKKKYLVFVSRLVLY